MSSVTSIPSTSPSPPSYVTEADFDVYELGFLVACVVFSGVSLMLIAAVIGLFIKVQNLQRRIQSIMSPSKSLRPTEELSKRYTMMGGKNPKIKKTDASLRYQSGPETSGFQSHEYNEKGMPSAMRHSDRTNDLYY